MHILALDLGTTTCKAIAITKDGEILASASDTYELHSPQPGWAEQDADEVWDCVVKTLRELTAALPDERPVGLSFSAAMHTLLPVDTAGKPLSPATTWADNRAGEQAAALRQNADISDIYNRTGVPLNSVYFPARLTWLRENLPDVLKSMARIVSLKDWVIFRLTGVWMTDYAVASATGLLNIHALAWDESALKLAGITAEQLPPLNEPKTVVAEISAQATNEVGLPAGLAVVLGASDGALANLGAGVTQPGQRVITIGTSGAVRIVNKKPILSPLQQTWCYAFMRDSYFAGGAINNGGLALQWIRERFYPDLEGDAGYDQLMKDAESIAPGAENLLLLPYFSGERSPHWNPDVRATFHGLALEHQRAHIARAALEAVAYCLADVWQALDKAILSTGGELKSMPARLTGTITRSPVWGQILADVLGIALNPVEAADGSILGAASLGFWALGHLPKPDALVMREGSQPEPDIKPDAERHAFYQQQHRRFQKLFNVLQLYENDYA